jgi:hypothetical protein
MIPTRRPIPILVAELLVSAPPSAFISLTPDQTDTAPPTNIAKQIRAPAAGLRSPVLRIRSLLAA